MKIPRSVKIGAYRYKIKWAKEIKEDGEDCFGKCDSIECIIWLRNDIKKNETRLQEVFLHECLHAIEHSYGVDLPENIINTLGLGLINLIADNGLLFGDWVAHKSRKRA